MKVGTVVSETTSDMEQQFEGKSQKEKKDLLAMSEDLEDFIMDATKSKEEFEEPINSEVAFLEVTTKHEEELRRSFRISQQLKRLVGGSDQQLIMDHHEHNRKKEVRVCGGRERDGGGMGRGRRGEGEGEEEEQGDEEGGVVAWCRAAVAPVQCNIVCVFVRVCRGVCRLPRDLEFAIYLDARFYSCEELPYKLKNLSTVVCHATHAPRVAAMKWDQKLDLMTFIPTHYYKR